MHETTRTKAVLGNRLPAVPTTCDTAIVANGAGAKPADENAPTAQQSNEAPRRHTIARPLGRPTERKHVMKISARNQLSGTVASVKEGAVNGVVSIDLGSTTIKADITMEAIKDLGLKEGMDAVAIVKATNVMFAKGTDRIAGISARNQIAGTVVEVKEGAVNGHVALETADGSRIKGSITNEAIEQLGLAVGEPALAIVKSTDVIVGVE